MPYQTKLELVKVTDDSKIKIEKKDLFLYEPKISPHVYQFFKKYEDIFYHINRLMQNNGYYSSVINYSDSLKITTQSNKNSISLKSFYSNLGVIDLFNIKENINLSVKENFDQIVRLFYQSINRYYISNSKYNVNYNTFIDLSNDLLSKSNIKNDKIKRISDYIHLYGGFNYVLRTFYDNLYIQISPKCSITIDSDLDYILKNELFTKTEVLENFENVYLPIGRGAQLIQILDKRVNDPIEEEPFSGKNFLEFAKEMYPDLKFTNRESNLILVLPFGNTIPWYFSTELVVPSITFTDLATLDSAFYRNILAKSKNYSATRENHIQKFIDEKLFTYLDEEICLEPTPASILKDVIPISPNIYEPKHDPVYIIKPPEVVFYNKVKGEVEHIHRDLPTYTASPVDIMNTEELTCFHAPNKINVVVFSDSKYLKDSSVLINELKKSFPKYFNCELIVEDPIPIDDLSITSPEYAKLDRQKIDCVLVFGPRYIKGDRNKTKLIYTVPETAILNQGIPVQFVADDSSQYKEHGQSIQKKARNTYAVFGIGLNILSKIGSKIMGLYEETYSQFIPNSVIMGYNVIRVYDKSNSEVVQGQSIRQLVRNATKLAAPIVMFSEDGNDIILQDVFELPSETVLFKDHGKQIFDKIQPRYKTIIVHKDGRFFNEELTDLTNLCDQDLMIIPVSIVSNLAPRMFSSKRANRTPNEGTTFRLSQNDFLMSTPLITSEILESGWPNTILITIHDIQNSLSEKDRIRILYQLFALTRIHQSSQIPTRKPISIHYSNAMGEFLRKCEDPHPNYFRYFVNKRNRHGYIPKIFL